MDRIKGRPLVLFGAVFLPSVALFFFVQMRVRLLCAVICVLLLLFPLLLRRCIAAAWPKRLLRGGRAVFSGLLCGSLLAAAWFFFSFSPWEQDFGQTVFVQGTVTEISYVSDYSFSATLFTTKTPRGIGASFLTLRGEFSPSLCVGDRVTVSGILSSFSEEPKRYTRLTALGQGKAAILTVADAQALQNEGPAPFSPTAWFDRLRRGAAARFENHYDGVLASLCQDLLLGMRDTLDPMLRRDFTRLGLSHVLAVSGLHFSIFIGLADTVLRRMRLRKTVRCLLLIPCILFFIGFCGASPSVLRAGIMLLMLQLSYLLGTQNDALTSLFFAGIMIVFFSPGSVFDCSFLLSFLATLGIITVGQGTAAALRARFPQMPRLFLGILSSFAITCSALLFTTPVVLLYFRRISVLSLFSNLLFEPFAQLLIPLSLLLLALSYVPPLAAVFNFSVSFLLRWHLRGMHVAANLPFAVAAVKSGLAAAAAAVLYAAGIIAAFLRRRRGLFYLNFAVCCAVLFLGNAAFYAAERDTVTAFYTCEASGESVVLCSGQKGAIIDCSAGNYSVLNAAAQTLTEQGRTEIDTIVYTHLHRRSITSLQSVGKRYLVRSILLPQGEKQALLSSMENAARRLDISVQFYDETETEIFPFGNAGIVLFPRAMLARSAEPLCSFGVQAAARKVLFASPLYDTAAPAYRAMLEDYAAQSDVTLFLSHGPKQRGGCKLPATQGSVYAASGVAVAGAPLQQTAYLDRLTIRISPRAKRQSN